MGLKLAAGLTLDNGLRPQAIAGVAPTLDYRFARDKREIEAVSLTDKLTYTGGNGTFVGSDGYIQRATTNVPRFDHDPLSRVSEGLLVEGSRENIVLQSENFLTTWSGSTSPTVTVNTTVAPDGKTTADTIGASAIASYIFQPVIFTGNGDKAYSVFLKAGTSSSTVVNLRDFSAGQSRGTAVVTWAAGIPSVVVSGGSLLDVQSHLNGWYRIMVLAAGVVAANTNQFRIQPDSSVGTGNVIIWGFQAENAASPSTYIPTTTTTVTRTADSAVIDGTGVLTGTYTIVEKPVGCAVESGGNIVLQEGYTAERVMVFPAALSAAQITAIREAM